MPSDTQGVAVPAPSAEGTGKVASTTENLSADQVVAKFMRMDSAKAKPATAVKEAPEAQAEEEGGDQTNADGEVEQTTPPEAEAKSESETPETEEVAETEGKEEGKDEADDVLSPETKSLDAKTKQKIQKRIDREVSKRKTLEEQVQQLNEKLSQLSQPQTENQAKAPVQAEIPPVGKAPLPDIKDPTQLVEYRKSAKETVRWAEEILDRDDIDSGVQIGEKEYSKSEIKAILRNAKTALEDTIPAQAEWFQQQAAFSQQKTTLTQQAHQKFPFLADRNSPEYKQAQEMYRSAPWLHNLAASEWFLGAYIKGMSVLMAEEKAAQAKTAKKEPEPKAKVTIPKGRPPGDQTEATSSGTSQRLTPEAGSQRAVTVEFDKLRAKKGVTAEDAARFLEHRDSLRNR